jgi:SAM-dependent methyltransferase
MREFLMKLLECPECRKGSLRLKIEERREENIISGEISCGCGRIYPVINGIPRFIRNYQKTSQVQKRFEYQWKKWGADEVIFGRTREESKKFFLDFSGSSISPEYLKGKVVLDGGCGHGRFAEIMAEFGGFSVGLDIGSGVEIARCRVEKYPNASIVQGDIMNPPFKRGVFDYIWSNGVIHHTPDTRESFAQLVKVLKSGGYLDIWLYPKKSLLWEIFQKAIRSITTRMPAGMLEFFCYLVVPLLSVVPTFSKTSFPKNSLRECAQVIYDWYSPKYQSHHTNEEIVEWYRQEGFSDIEVLDLPVAISGKKIASR